MMDKLLKGEIRPSLVGLGQAVAVVAYCGLVATFLFYATGFMGMPGVLGVFMMLSLLVFSASVTGTLVFGLPVYFALNKKTKEALSILGHTLFYLMLIIAFTGLAVFLTNYGQKPPVID